jgi:cobalt-zinc-cadmium efflux system outer membrane protein
VKVHFAAFLLLVFINGFSYAQPAPGDTLFLTSREAEALFLNNNLDLIAQKLSIQQAEAQIIQAKLWPNPEFSLGELNLWATKGQLSSGESLPPLAGNFGKNRQISAELEQLIETGGKRKKRIALESVSRDMAQLHFAELIREMKTGLRKNLYGLSYHQSFLSVLKTQHDALGQLLTGFENQYSQGNLNKTELFRLKAARLELGQQMVEVQKEIHQVQKELTVLLNIPVGSYLVADMPDDTSAENLKRLSLSELIALANENRPDAKMSLMENTWAQKKYELEYAERKPDLTLGANYDRGGNFLRNFIGFGLKMDLPVFNRNQGAILDSRLGIEKSKVGAEQKTKQIEAEVTVTFQDLQKSLEAYQSLDSAYVSDLDQVFRVYTQYFVQRQISMLQYLDFFEAYLSNKRTIFLTIKQLYDNREELRYVTGTEIN